MQHLRVNDHDMAYLEVGGGTPLVCVHGSLCDFRIWSPVLGPLSRQHRVIAVSMRHYFPEHWDGAGPGFTMAQHVADAIAFIEALGEGPVHLMGHSRGGHIAFRVAQHRPDLCAGWCWRNRAVIWMRRWLPHRPGHRCRRCVRMPSPRRRRSVRVISKAD
jgi:pimeloyl-ACP methyl ester carboxylesterase